MITLPTGSVNVLPPIRRSGGSRRGSGGPPSDDTLWPVYVILGFMGLLSLIAFGWIAHFHWSTSIVKRESARVTLAAIRSEAVIHRHGKYGKYQTPQWAVELEEKGGKRYWSHFYRGSKDSPFKLNHPFETRLVTHTQRNGHQLYYLTDITKDIPRHK